MVKRLIKKGLASPWGWRLSAPLRRRGVIVLMYHRINAGPAHFPGLDLAHFRRQMEWLRENCTPIWPERMFEAARQADRQRPPVIVTFDDGFRDYHDCAYPILRSLDIPAVVFLSTQFMDRGGVIWTEALHWAATATRRQSARLPWQPEREWPLVSPAERLRFVAECKAYLKNVPDDERRRHAARIQEELDVPPPEECLGRQMLNWDEVRATHEGTRFGGHSHSHPILSRLQPAEMETEIRLCRERIAAETGTEPRYFAYPNGRAADFNQTTRDLLRQQGFLLAFSTIEGINGPDADSFALRRIGSWWERGIEDFATQVARA